MSVSASTDVLVVGGGPAGAATAIRLARAGHEVTLLERRVEAVQRTRGDVLDPGAVGELRALGIDPLGGGAHETHGTRMWYGDRCTSVPWPDDAPHAVRGVVWSRPELNRAMLDEATHAGARVLTGHEATTPIVERGFVRGANVTVAAADLIEQGIEHGATAGQTEHSEIECRFLVVADGANSRFGRVLGTTRDRNWPYAVSTNASFVSPLSTERWIDTVLGVPDRNDNPTTGHGWVNPVGDGTVNVGVTVLSSYRDILGVNTLKLLDSFVESVAVRWSIDPRKRLSEPGRWRTPLGGSIRPIMGPTFLVAGDAAGMANPFNCHGVGAAMMTGRVAAEVLAEALTVGNSTTLQRYPAQLDAEIGTYHKVGRLSARVLGRPRLLELALRTGIRSDAAMGAAVRIASNELRRANAGSAERAYAIARIIARFAPSW